MRRLLDGRLAGVNASRCLECPQYRIDNTPICTTRGCGGRCGYPTAGIRDEEGVWWSLRPPTTAIGPVLDRIGEPVGEVLDLQDLFSPEKIETFKKSQWV